MSAAQFVFSDDVRLDLDTALTWGAQWRTESADKELLDGQITPTNLQSNLLGSLKKIGVAINMNDGNNNFDTGLVSNRLTLLTDLDLHLGYSSGIFLRAKAFYDDVYASNETDMDEQDYLTYNSATDNGGNAALGEFSPRAKAAHEQETKFLDAFFYTDFDFNDSSLNIRIGRQAISWGETTFYGGISAAQNRIDATVVNLPGVEVKEILLPTGAFYGQLRLNTNTSLEAYYQYEWTPSRMNGSGSYFSTNDQIGAGASSFLVPLPNSSMDGFTHFSIPRLEADRPSDDGQWGLALRYETNSGTELGVYNLVYHDKTPSFVMQGSGPLPENYYIRYFDKIRMIGASIATDIASINLLGEINYRDNAPVVTNSLFRTPIRSRLLQTTLGGTRVYGPTFFSDDLNLTMEAVYLRNNGMDDDDLEFDAAASGISAAADVIYNSALPATDIIIPIFVSKGIKGTIKEANLTEGAVAASIGIRAVYRMKLQADLRYTHYSGGGFDNWIGDRDNASVTIKYTY